MVTKIINTGGDGSSSTSALWAVVVLALIGLGAYIAWSQGYLGGNRHEVNVTLPGGESVSGSVNVKD